ncbi:ECF transporter S component [Thermanaerosceptrum fracticalcis]|uniref:ECF transporter S component n=1 Tax=Thermanaerosceptrum fracticalcis TaxID=1712410 RepID=UPI00054ED040|nr:ECF transporter S component [Thermanaerosceptrum fracticalcis]
MNNNHAKQTITAGLLIALGLVLPMAFHTFGMGGPVFLPMHIPVLLGGFVLSPLYALLVGMVTPIASSVLTSMPPLFPGAVQMMFELGTYGLVISYLYHKRNISLFPTLLTGMLAGRFVAGAVNYLLLTQFLAKAFKLKVFLTAAFVTAVPGIIIQLVIIPIMVRLLEKANFIMGKENINDSRTQS